MSILEILEKAKALYEQTDPYRRQGMCWTICSACPPELESYIYHNKKLGWIPEFNPEFLGGSLERIAMYWWPISDHKSRLRAFDKLINVYRNK